VASPAVSADKRNPFGVPDVPDPTGEDVKAFAAAVKLAGGEKDNNAEAWVKEATEGKPGSPEGDWQSRWSGGKGTVRVKVVNDRVYFLSLETEGNFKGRTYLLECVRDKNKLMGRWIDVANPDDSHPFVGLIVDDERIDGAWAADSRWDFRRKLKK
jgi:hypothetical protein